MIKPSSLLISFLLALPSLSMFALVPLYVDPGTSASGWKNLTATIAAFPTVQWQVVINPDSGPGPVTSSGYPTDNDYISGLSKLNGYPNVITLGYVDTNFTRRAYSKVISDIDVYANWAYYPDTKYNISIGGIFFDDIVSTPPSVYPYYQNISAYAYANVPSTVTPVIFNPGAPPPSTAVQMFDYCDTMIEFENYFTNYTNLTAIETFTPGYNGQAAIVLHNTTGRANVKSLVHTMVENGVEAVYFSSDGLYNVLDATLLQQIAGAVVAG